MKNYYKLFVLFSIFVLVVVLSAQLKAQVVLTAAADTYARGASGTASSSTVNGADTVVRVRGVIGDNKRNAYLKFDLSNVTETFTTATLKLTVDKAVGSAHPSLDRADFFTVVDDSWDETTLNFNNAPVKGTYLFSAVIDPLTSSDPPRKVYEFDVSDYVIAEFNGDKIVSFYLSDTLDASTDTRFYSKEAKTPMPPQLVLTTTTGVEENGNIIPISFSVKQNYPNPFNPSTIIEYSLPANGYIDVSVYNLLGQKISTLFNGETSAGQHQLNWNGKNQFGFNVSSGIYFTKISFAGQIKTIKMILNR